MTKNGVKVDSAGPTESRQYAADIAGEGLAINYQNRARDIMDWTGEQRRSGYGRRRCEIGMEGGVCGLLGTFFFFCVGKVDSMLLLPIACCSRRFGRRSNWAACYLIKNQARPVNRAAQHFSPRRPPTSRSFLVWVLILTLLSPACLHKLHKTLSLSSSHRALQLQLQQHHHHHYHHHHHIHHVYPGLCSEARSCLHGHHRL